MFFIKQKRNRQFMWKEEISHQNIVAEIEDLEDILI